MLDVKQPVIARRYPARFGTPTLGTRVRRVDADIDDLRDLLAKLTDHSKTVPIPGGVGNQIDGHGHPQRAGKLERIEVLAKSYPLAKLFQAFLVNGLDTQKHVLEPNIPPELENLLVAQEDVASGFQVILLLDAAFGDHLADAHPVLCLNKGDVVQEEHARFFNSAQFFDRALRGFSSVTSPVESPCAAEYAIPRAAAAELDRGARVKHANKVLAAVAEQISGWQHGIETLHEGWPGTFPGCRVNARYPVQVSPVLTGRLQSGNDYRLAFTFEHRVDAALPMCRISAAVKEALWPPTIIRACGRSVRVAVARSM